MNREKEFRVEMLAYALEFVGGLLIIGSVLMYSSSQQAIGGGADIGKSSDVEETALDSHVGDESVDAANSRETTTTVTTTIKQTNMDINESAGVKVHVPDEAELYPEERLDSEETTETKGWKGNGAADSEKFEQID